MSDYRITAQEKEFAIKFMETNDQVQAINFAYPKRVATLTQSGIQIAASKLLKKPDIQAFIKDVRRELSGTVLYDLNTLVIDLVQIATADPNEIVQVRRECCRYCWGAGHHYQWTEWEYEAAIRDYEKEAQLWDKKGRDPESEPTLPDDYGGMGYNHTLSPNAACPRCFGEGQPRVFMNDSRYLSPGAKKLYAGAKLDKNGNIEAIMHSQQEARAQLMRIFGAWSPARDATPQAIRGAADKVSEHQGIVINLIDSPDAD